ncbi:hypothetical protein SAMN04515647_3435 [Cohaesibacter sp. ES.047]|nr:hypothetical protein SAMN04515647_3435 [Cohaesibacter sp. ES.047]
MVLANRIEKWSGLIPPSTGRWSSSLHPEAFLTMSKAAAESADRGPSFTIAGAPRPVDKRLFEEPLEGRSPGLRHIRSKRLPGGFAPVACCSVLSAYSCGGSYGIGPELGHPHHIPFSSPVAFALGEPSPAFLHHAPAVSIAHLGTIFTETNNRTQYSRSSHEF